VSFFKNNVASFQLQAISRKGNDMTKTLDLISEIIRSPKHSFRQVDTRPAKSHKHRYERRKVKEFIKLGDWSQDLA